MHIDPQYRSLAPTRSTLAKLEPLVVLVGLPNRVHSLSLRLSVNLLATECYFVGHHAFTLASI